MCPIGKGAGAEKWGSRGVGRRSSRERTHSAKRSKGKGSDGSEGGRRLMALQEAGNTLAFTALGLHFP